MDARALQYLTDFEAASDQLKSSREELLPWINPQAIFDDLSDNSGRYMRYNAFTILVDDTEGARELFDEFTKDGDPGLDIDGFIEMLGIPDTQFTPRYDGIDLRDTLAICRTFLVSFCGLHYSIEKSRNDILNSRHFIATITFRKLRNQSRIPAHLNYSHFTRALYSGIAHSH